MTATAAISPQVNRLETMLKTNFRMRNAATTTATVPATFVNEPDFLLSFAMVSLAGFCVTGTRPGATPRNGSHHLGVDKAPGGWVSPSPDAGDASHDEPSRPSVKPNDQEHPLNGPFEAPSCAQSLRVRGTWCALLAPLGAVALAVLAATPPAHAQSREDGTPAETLGTGDNAHASVWGPAALFINPAGLSRAHAVIVEGGYSYLEGRSGHAFTAAASDGMTNDYMAMGVAYTYMTGAPGGIDRDGHQFRGALSTGYVTKDVALYAGAGVRYLGLTIGKSDAKSDEHNDVDAWTADIGLMLDIANRIRVGVTGANLVDTKTTEAPRKLGLGLGLIFDALAITADMDVDLSGAARTIPRFGFGAEYSFAQAFHARVGFVSDQLLAEERIAAGFGYANNEFALDLGYSAAVQGSTDMVFALSFRYTPPMRQR